MDTEALDNFNKGKALSEKGKYREALEYFDKSINRNPHYKEVYNEKGKVLTLLGKEKEAIRNFVFATMVDPDYKDAWMNMEAVHLILENYSNALRCIDQVIRIDPMDKDAYVRKAKILLKLNERREAHQCLVRAMEIDPLVKSTFTDKEIALLHEFSIIGVKAMKEVRKKVCLLGDKSVGKTSLIRRFVYDVFEDRYLATIGAKITKKDMEIRTLDNSINIKLNMIIWDIAGQEKFNEVRKIYYQGCKGVMLVCDVTREDTLHNILNWANAIYKVVGRIPTICIGNKIDLETDSVIDEEDIRDTANKINADVFLTSAKTGINVDQAFLAMGIAMCKE